MFITASHRITSDLFWIACQASKVGTNFRNSYWYALWFMKYLALNRKSRRKAQKGRKQKQEKLFLLMPASSNQGFCLAYFISNDKLIIVFQSIHPFLISELFICPLGLATGSPSHGDSPIPGRRGFPDPRNFFSGTPRGFSTVYVFFFFQFFYAK